MKSLNLLIVSVALGILGGCANLPSTEVMKAEVESYRLPRLPDNGKAIVYVVRPSQLGGLIRFNVFLNDQEANSEMGYTRGAQYIYFNIPPGTHKVLSKAENWAEIAFEAKEGEIIFLQQEPSMGVLIARNSVFKLDDIQGKYNVKTLTLGTILKTEK